MSNSSSQFNCTVCTGNSTLCSNLTEEEDCGSNFIPHVSFKVFQVIVLLAITLASIGLNSIVLIVAVARKNLHTRDFILPLQIMCTNLLFSVAVFPLTILTAGVGSWILGDGVCDFVGIVNSVYISSRLLFSLVASLDRIFSVFLLFCYNRNGVCVSLIMSAIAWLVILIYSILPVKDIFDYYEYMPLLNSCIPDQVDSFLYERFFVSVITFLGVGLPFVLNVVLFCKARKMALQVLPSTGTSEEDYQELISNRKRELRAIITVLLLFGGLCLNMPVNIAIVIFFASGNHGPVLALIIRCFAIPLYFLLLVFDPLIILRNKEFRSEARKLFVDLKAKIQLYIQDYCTR